MKKNFFWLLRGAFGTDFYDRSILRPKHRAQGLINRWAKWAIAQAGKLLGAANFHSTCRNKLIMIIILS